MVIKVSQFTEEDDFLEQEDGWHWFENSNRDNIDMAYTIQIS